MPKVQDHLSTSAWTLQLAEVRCFNRKFSHLRQMQFLVSKLSEINCLSLVAGCVGLTCPCFHIQISKSPPRSRSGVLPDSSKSWLQFSSLPSA